MGLREYQKPSEKVDLPGGQSMSVRGVSFSDLASLFVRHAPALTAMFAMFRSKTAEGKLGAEDVGALMVAASDQFPEAVAHLIALSAGEPDAIEQAATLPLPVQWDALSKIINLTFGSEADIKKFLEIVDRTVKKADNAISGSLLTPSGNGFGSFAAE